jgi:hypothetical protein
MTARAIHKPSAAERALAMQLIFKIASRCANRQQASETLRLMEQDMNQLFRFMEYALTLVYDDETEGES